MSVLSKPMDDGRGAAARAEAARRRGVARLSATIDDLFLADDARLDDRTRAVLIRVVGAIVGTIEADLRRRAAALLTDWAEDAAAATLLAAPDTALALLARAGLLRETALMDEIIGCVRQDLLAEMLPLLTAAGDRPDLLVRLTDVADDAVAVAARALLAALARRRDEAAAGGWLSADTHHRLLWWTAAAIRDAAAGDPLIDRAIEAAALGNLAAHDEGDRVEAMAMRLAIAIDARPGELPALLLDSLGDGALALFIAVLARASALDYDQARAIVLDHEGDPLWLVLRAVGLDRATIARIGLSLADADPRRDVEAFADALDAIAAVDQVDARLALAPFAAHADLRRAIDDIARSRAA